MKYLSGFFESLRPDEEYKICFDILDISQDLLDDGFKCNIDKNGKKFPLPYHLVIYCRVILNLRWWKKRLEEFMTI